MRTKLNVRALAQLKYRAAYRLRESGLTFEELGHVFKLRSANEARTLVAKGDRMLNPTARTFLHMKPVGPYQKLQTSNSKLQDYRKSGTALPHSKT